MLFLWPSNTKKTGWNHHMEYVPLQERNRELRWHAFLLLQMETLCLSSKTLNKCQWRETQPLPFKDVCCASLEWEAVSDCFTSCAEMQEAPGELSPNNAMSSLLLANFPMSIPLQGLLWLIWPTEARTKIHLVHLRQHLIKATRNKAPSSRRRPPWSSNLSQASQDPRSSHLKRPHTPSDSTLGSRVTSSLSFCIDFSTYSDINPGVSRVYWEFSRLCALAYKK